MIREYSSQNYKTISNHITENQLFTQKLKNHFNDTNPSQLSSSSTIINDTSVNEISSCYKNQFPYSIEIVFKIENTKLPYDCNTVLASCPALSEQISKIQNPSGTITINLPKWIKRNDLLEYFFYFKNGIVINNKDNYYRTMLKLSDFFNNCDFLEKIITNNIIPNLTNESALIFLVDSFQNISDKHYNQNNRFNNITNSNSNNENNYTYETKKYLWYELFYSCKDYLCDNLILYITNPVFKSKIIQFREDLLESIIAQYLKQNSSTKAINEIMKVNNTLINNRKNNEEEIYKFILEFSKVNNIYDVINKNDNENSFYCTESNSSSFEKDFSNKKEIKTKKILSFLDNNNYPLFDYYFDKEITGKINIPPLKYGGGVSLLFSVVYDSKKDCVSLTVKINHNIKSGGNKINMFLLNNILSVKFFYFFNNEENNLSSIIKPMKVNYIDEDGIQHSNLKATINENKQLQNEYTLISLYSFSNLNIFKISMYVKINFIHSFLINYFIDNISSFYNDITNIPKLSIEIVKLLLITVSKDNYNNAISLFLNWFDSKMNEDIFKEIFLIIKWENVNKENIYFFIVKYITLINDLGFEEEFIKRIENKIDRSVITVSKQINYYDLYKQKNITDNFALSDVNSLKEISTIRNNNKDNNILDDTGDKLLCNELISKEKVPSRNKKASLHSKNPQCQSINSNKITMSSSQPRIKPLYSSMNNKDFIHVNNNNYYCNMTNNSSNYFINK